MAAWRIRTCSFAGSYGQAPHTATFVRRPSYHHRHLWDQPMWRHALGFWASGGQQDYPEATPVDSSALLNRVYSNALPSLVDQWSRQAQRDEAHTYASTVSPSALLLQVRTSLIPSVAIETRKPSSSPSSPSESMIHGV